MHFSMEMKPDEFLPYLEKYYADDKAQAVSQSKLALITWLGNLVEKAHEHHDWYLLTHTSGYDTLQIENKTPLQWLEDERESELHKPVTPKSKDFSSLAGTPALFFAIMRRPLHKQFSEFAKHLDYDVLSSCDWENTGQYSCADTDLGYSELLEQCRSSLRRK